MSSEDMRDFIAAAAVNVDSLSLEGSHAGFLDAIDLRPSEMRRLPARLVLLCAAVCSAKDATEAARRIARLTDEDLQRIDQEQMDPDEVEFADRPRERVQGMGGGGGPAMMFAMVHYGDGAVTKEQTDRLAERWQLLLGGAGVDVRLYTIADDRLLITLVNGQLLVPELRQFLLAQPETAAIEMNGVKTYGPADGPAYRAKMAADNAAAAAARDKARAESEGAAAKEGAGEKKAAAKKKRKQARKDEM